MQYPRIARRLFEWNLKGTEKQGRPMKTWLDKINEDANELGTKIDELSTRAESRLKWKRTIAAL